MARAGRTALALVSCVLLVACVSCSRTELERRIKSVHGDRIDTYRVLKSPEGDPRLQVALVLRGEQRPSMAQMCAILATAARESQDGTVAVSYAVTRRDGTSDTIMMSWCADTGDLILWEGRAPGPKGEGLSTEFPVSYARDVTLEQIESASKGASLEMDAWLTE
ncbi:hypothetical protein MX659_03140 [Coriobacteriia bacterium Es71-Z0120]|uniref:hypothetical protein n=1 Tax=Parvivirga hydrogeniphila TaxID=2939460 RepID=UPI002260B151|nr:hypothetical protein [Parvivirga hydrogeniphila]MCL4078596.1 hypothetical protein [Parvivirga hydrogeniphila]